MTSVEVHAEGEPAASCWAGALQVRGATLAEWLERCTDYGDDLLRLQPVRRARESIPTTSDPCSGSRSASCLDALLTVLADD